MSGDALARYYKDVIEEYSTLQNFTPQVFKQLSIERCILQKIVGAVEVINET